MKFLRNRVRSKEERKNALVKKKEAERKSKGILKAKERQSLKDKDEYLAKLKSQSKETEFLQDVWESECKRLYFFLETCLLFVLF